MSAEGHFSIEVPSGFALFVGQKPSVDGVMAPMPGGIALQSGADPAVLVSIRGLAVDVGTSVDTFLEETDPCSAKSPGREGVSIDGAAGILIRDTPCGPYGGSTYAIVRGHYGYLIQVEYHGSFEDVRRLVDPLLATFRAIE